MLSFYLSMIDTDADKVKFGDIYYTYRGFVQCIVREETGNLDLAEDAEQEAFEKIIRYLNRINDVQSVETKVFITVIAKSAAKDLMRRERKYLDCCDFEDAPVMHSAQNVEREIIQHELDEKVLALPDFYRDPLVLKYFYGMKYTEIADALHTTTDSIRKRLQRGKRLLSIRLEDWGK